MYNNPLFLLLFFFLGVICLAILRILQNAYRKGIRDVPGPWVAKFSILYRLTLIIRGKAPEEYGKLHDKYGQIVRVGPNQVSINDPTAILQIYGISSKSSRKLHWMSTNGYTSQSSTAFPHHTMRVNSSKTCSLPGTYKSIDNYAVRRHQSIQWQT